MNRFFVLKDLKRVTLPIITAILFFACVALTVDYLANKDKRTPKSGWPKRLCDIEPSRTGWKTRPLKKRVFKRRPGVTESSTQDDILARQEGISQQIEDLESHIGQMERDLEWERIMAESYRVLDYPHRP